MRVPNGDYRRHHGRCLCGGKWRRYHRDGYGQRLWRLGSPIKLADVTTGLDIAVTAATGLQCDAGEAVATIMFTEGFNSAIRAVADVPDDGDVDESDGNSVLVLNFRGIPDGVTVTASLMGTGEAMKDDGTDLAPLML